jgi:DNA polymerase-1
MIEAPLDELESKVADAQRDMAEASRIALGGFELRSEANLIRYPERYRDDRGTKMWETVWAMIERVEQDPTIGQSGVQ